MCTRTDGSAGAHTSVCLPSGVIHFDYPELKYIMSLQHCLYFLCPIRYRRSCAYGNISLHVHQRLKCRIIHYALCLTSSDNMNSCIFVCCAVVFAKKQVDTIASLGHLTGPKYDHNRRAFYSTHRQLVFVFYRCCQIV